MRLRMKVGLGGRRGVQLAQLAQLTQLQLPVSTGLLKWNHGKAEEAAWLCSSCCFHLRGTASHRLQLLTTRRQELRDHNRRYGMEGAGPPAQGRHYESSAYPRDLTNHRQLGSPVEFVVSLVASIPAKPSLLEYLALFPTSTAAWHSLGDSLI